MPDPRYLFQPILYRAITPIHVGSGQDVGIVDLPVIRERTTDHPFLPGSGIRGALRARSAAEDPELTKRIFGKDDLKENITSGCLSVLDAHLLLFPVRSAPGLFHWITCPFLLARHRDLQRQLCGEAEEVPAPPEEPPSDGTFLGGAWGTVHLEEYPFTAGEGDWRWTGDMEGVDPDRVVLVSDADFLHFARTATLVRQRNRLSTAKTVLQGALFSVEALPSETWLLGFVGATEERIPTADGDSGSEEAPLDPPAPLVPEQVLGNLRRLVGAAGDETSTHLQLGGDESVGLGITRLAWRAA